jgi:type IV pilus assembly protein PilB
MKSAQIERRAFADVLIREGVLPVERMKNALRVQQRTGEPIEEILVEEGDLSEWDIARVLVKHHKLPFLQISRYAVSRDVLSVFPADFLRQNTILPLDLFGKTVNMAIGRSLVPGLKEIIVKEFKLHPFFFVSTLTDVKNALNLHFPTPFSEFDGLLTDVKKTFKEIGQEWDVDEELES